jgi:hypothetical protein
MEGENIDLIKDIFTKYDKDILLLAFNITTNDKLIAFLASFVLAQMNKEGIINTKSIIDKIKEDIKMMAIKGQSLDPNILVRIPHEWFDKLGDPLNN